MPNWCDCEMQIVGPAATISTLMDAIKVPSDPTKLALTNLFPIPEDLAGLSTGFTTINGEEHTVWKSTPDGPQPIDTDALIEKYGTASWYDWCLENWGTKWGDCDTAPLDATDRYFFLEETESEILLGFQSAWSPPIKLITHIAAKFPDCKFSLRYWECGMGYQGHATWENGEPDLDVSYEYHGSRGG